MAEGYGSSLVETGNESFGELEGIRVLIVVGSLVETEIRRAMVVREGIGNMWRRWHECVISWSRIRSNQRSIRNNRIMRENRRTYRYEKGQISRGIYS